MVPLVKPPIEKLTVLHESFPRRIFSHVGEKNWKRHCCYLTPTDFFCGLAEVLDLHQHSHERLQSRSCHLLCVLFHVRHQSRRYNLLDELFHPSFPNVYIVNH